MVLEGLTVFAAGYWLAESRTTGAPQSVNRESVAGFLQDAFDLAWQLLLLVGLLGWVFQVLSLRLPQVSLAGLGLTLVLAYGLSLLRRRPEGAAEPYFLALAMIAFSAQQGAASGGTKATLGLAMLLLGGSLACETVLLGLRERLRWLTASSVSLGAPMMLLGLAFLAVIVWIFGF